MTATHTAAATQTTVPLRHPMIDPKTSLVTLTWGQWFFRVGQSNVNELAKLQGAFATLAGTVNAQALRLDAVETVNAAQAQTITEQSVAIAQLLAKVERLGADVEALQLAPLAYLQQT